MRLRINMTMPTSDIHVKLYAAARDSFGSHETFVAPTSVAQTLAKISENNSQLAQIFQRCSILIDGVQCHDYEYVLAPGESVDILPPFAGG